MVGDEVLGYALNSAVVDELVSFTFTDEVISVKQVPAPKPWIVAKQHIDPLLSSKKSDWVWLPDVPDTFQTTPPLEMQVESTVSTDQFEKVWQLTAGTVPAAFHLGDVPLSVTDVRAAIDLLTASTDARVKTVLAAAHSKVAAVAFTDAMLAEVRAYDPTLKARKDAVVAFLRRLLAGSTVCGPFEVSPSGYMLPPVPLTSVSSHFYEADTIRKTIRSIAASFANPRLVGRGVSKMDLGELRSWIGFWLRGNLRGCYDLEATYTKPHRFHPGHPDRPSTNQVTWRPAIDSEVPAGAFVYGDFNSPESLNDTEINAYLFRARCAHPTHMTAYSRRLWVRSHMKGDQRRVDSLSKDAAHRAAAGASPLSDPPVDTVLPELKQWPHWLDSEPMFWPPSCLAGYLHAHGEPNPLWWRERVAAVIDHIALVKARSTYDPAYLPLTVAADQPDLAGFHRKLVCVDRHDREWIFKPVADDDHRFRAEAEHGAHVLARRLGFPTAESALRTIDDRYGQIQLRHRVARTLADVCLTDLTVDQLVQIGCEHLLDWVLDNDDAHDDNIVITDSGQIVGIDKGRAFRYYGGWDGLAGDHAADSNCKLVYTKLYDAIADGHLPPSTVDAIYRAVIAHARRIQLVPDADITAIVAAAVAHRPHYQPSWYQQVVAGAATSEEELLAAVVARKNQLVADMTLLWSRVYTRAGLPVPDLTDGQIAVNALGQPVYAGLDRPNVLAQVAFTRNYGTSVFVAGTAVEDGHVLLWRERNPAGQFILRGQFKVRADATETLDNWCATRRTIPADATPTYLPNDNEYVSTIHSAAFEVNEDSDSDSVRAPLPAVENLAQLHTRLALEKAEAWAFLELGADDPTGRLAAIVARADLYQAHIELIRTHHKNRTEVNFDLLERYTWTPTPVVATPDPRWSVDYLPAQRPAATLGVEPVLDPDGELRLCGDNLANNGAHRFGQIGSLYRTTLATGEIIDFWGTTTNTPLTTIGQIEFTVAADTDQATGLGRLVEHLAAIGITLNPADATDLELFYWRHLVGILNNRTDTHTEGRHPKTGVMADRYATFRERLTDFTPTSRDAEIAAWRHAFAAFADETAIEAFTAAGGHLPRFGHHDLRAPGQPNGKPYWERFDVSAEKWCTQPLPSLSFRTGPRLAVATGAVLSTEARTRHLAMWKGGLSSTEDLQYGSGAFVFARQNYEGGPQNSILFNPRCLIRTSTYAFDGDRYGRIRDRHDNACFDFDLLTKVNPESNELCVKNSLTVLDDIEVCVFPTIEERAAAIHALAGLGITTVRGIPVGTRFVRYGDQTALRTALRAVRNTYRT